jgi:plasmid stabilization system protein ParE
MPIADYTSEAKTDFREIVEYIGRDDLGAALKWIDDIEGACDLLATRPEIGERVRSKRFGEARRHVVGNYLILLSAGRRRDRCLSYRAWSARPAAAGVIPERKKRDAVLSLAQRPRLPATSRRST